MTKFKAGDKVKIVGNSSGHQFRFGEIVYILNVGLTAYAAGRYRVDNSSRDWWYVKKDDIAPINSTAKVV